MPTVARLPSRIRIEQYVKDHNPPHFHAVQGDEEVLLRIADSAIYAGSLNPKALAEVRAWADIHRARLALNWIHALAQMPLEKIS